MQTKSNNQTTKIQAQPRTPSRVSLVLRRGLPALLCLLGLWLLLTNSNPAYAVAISDAGYGLRSLHDLRTGTYRF